MRTPKRLWLVVDDRAVLDTCTSERDAKQCLRGWQLHGEEHHERVIGPFVLASPPKRGAE